MESGACLRAVWEELRSVCQGRASETEGDRERGDMHTPPALLTRMWMPPWASARAWTLVATDASSTTSKDASEAWQPSALISSTTAWHSDLLRELISTCAPACARPMAIPFPNPLLEPVTRATFPFRLNMSTPTPSGSGACPGVSGVPLSRCEQQTDGERGAAERQLSTCGSIGGGGTGWW